MISTTISNGTTDWSSSGGPAGQQLSGQFHLEHVAAAVDAVEVEASSLSEPPHPHRPCRRTGRPGRDRRNNVAGTGARSPRRTHPGRGQRSSVRAVLALRDRPAPSILGPTSSPCGRGRRLRSPCRSTRSGADAGAPARGQPMSPVQPQDTGLVGARVGVDQRFEFVSSGAGGLVALPVELIIHEQLARDGTGVRSVSSCSASTLHQPGSVLSGRPPLSVASATISSWPRRQPLAPSRTPVPHRRPEHRCVDDDALRRSGGCSARSSTVADRAECDGRCHSVDIGSIRPWRTTRRTGDDVAESSWPAPRARSARTLSTSKRSPTTTPRTLRSVVVDVSSNIIARSYISSAITSAPPCHRPPTGEALRRLG